LQHAVLGKLFQDRRGECRDGGARGGHLLHEHRIVKGLMLREHRPADEPGCERKIESRWSGQRVGVEDHVAAVERKRKHGHRPLCKKLLLAAIDGDERFTGAGVKVACGESKVACGESNERRTLARTRRKRLRPGAGEDRLVKRGHAVGKVLAEGEHETEEDVRSGDAAKVFSGLRRVKGGHPDQSLGLEQLAHFADLVAVPQHRQHGNGKPGPPGREKRERLKREIGKLHRDPIAWLKPDLDKSECIDRGVSLSKAITMGPPEFERLGVGRVR
jgi:hypothetical protein